MKSSDFLQFAMKMLEAGLPFLVTGTPGAAKTALLSLVTERLGYDLIIGHPAIDTPIDYKGMPAQSKPATAKAPADYDFLPIGALRQLVRAKKPTVFLMDDFGHGTIATQNASCHLLHGRRIGEQKISDHVRICGATNTLEHKSGVNPTLENVKSRWTTIVQLDEDVDEWIKWASTCEDVGLLNKEVPFPPLVTAFIAWKRDMLYGFKPLPGLDNSNTPRTVHHFAQILMAGATNERTAFEVIKGAAGKPITIEFLAFLKLWAHLPDPNDILNNPNILDTMTFEKFQWKEDDHNPNKGEVVSIGMVPIAQRPDVAFALVTSCADIVRPKDMTEFVQLIKKFQKPVEVLGMMLVRNKNQGHLETSAFVRWATDNQQYML